METTVLPALSATESETQSAAKSLLPMFEGDTSAEKKNEYLSYRFTGFTVRESLELCHLHQRTVMRWRQHDMVFEEFDRRASMSESRKRVRQEIINNLFTRNYRLVLQKDYDVFSKAIIKPDEMTRQEETYLQRARAHYNPQQLQAIEQLLMQNGHPSEFDFVSLVLRRSTEVEVRAYQTP